MHIVTSAWRPPVRCSSAIALVVMMAPVAPSGWPIAIAPPFTLTRAVAYDPDEGRIRSYSLAEPGEHPDLPYDPQGYDPG